MLPTPRLRGVLLFAFVAPAVLIKTLINFTQPIFLVRANLVFVRIRYKSLEYKANNASSSYTAEPSSLRVAHAAAGSHLYLIPDKPDI